MLTVDELGNVVLVSSIRALLDPTFVLFLDDDELEPFTLALSHLSLINRSKIKQTLM